MSIFTKDIHESARPIKDEKTGDVFICFGDTGHSSEALLIDSPEKAHLIRDVINRGVDLYLNNKRR